MSQRLEKVLGHLSPAINPASESHTLSPQATSANFSKSPDDIVIISALRTPITKARKGGFKDTYVEELLGAVIKATLERTKIDPAKIDDIIVGTVLGNGSQRANEARIAGILAGVPTSVPVHTINRQCSSGLQAVAHVAANIKAGYYDVGLATGVETMSLAEFKWSGSMNPRVFLNQQAKDCLLPMGITSENVASRYGVTRKEQDEFAVLSNQRAAKAIKEGKFKDEIVPVKVKTKDPKTGAEKEVVIDTDDGVRADTTFEGLSKLKPAFQQGGTTTAGNSSQVSDGAAAVLLMKRKKAQQLGLPIIGVFRAFTVVGVDPSVMGIGPAFAIPAVLKQANINKDDVDLYEINEAFASQAVMSVKKIGLSLDKVNVNGGAIAIGHPLGATGARQIATILSELKKRKQKIGVTSMCIGSGMGAAAVIERE